MHTSITMHNLRLFFIFPSRRSFVGILLFLVFSRDQSARIKLLVQRPPIAALGMTPDTVRPEPNGQPHHMPLPQVFSVLVVATIILGRAAHRSCVKTYTGKTSGVLHTYITRLHYLQTEVLFMAQLPTCGINLYRISIGKPCHL